MDCDPATAVKLHDRHQVTERQVREAVQFDRYESAVWKDTPYGPRLMVTGTSDDNVRIKAWLRAVDRADGHFECRTAVRIP